MFLKCDAFEYILNYVPLHTPEYKSTSQCLYFRHVNVEKVTMEIFV